MSSYYAGYEGLALVLHGDERDEFQKRYLMLHPEADEDTLFRDRSFIQSDGSDGEIVICSQDDCDGMYLILLTNDEGVYAPNDRGFYGSRSLSLRAETCWVFYSDYQPSRVSALFSKPDYSSYEDLEREYKDKLHAYLPDDFPYHDHIGIFSYACFA